MALMRSLALAAALALALGMSAAPAVAGARDGTGDGSESGGRKAQNVVADVLFSRPLAVVQLLAGWLAYPVALPAGFVMDDPGFANRVCFDEPVARLVDRPLGEL